MRTKRLDIKIRSKIEYAFNLSFVRTVYFQIYVTAHGHLSVDDLDVRAHLQDEVVSRVPSHGKGCACRFRVSNCPCTCIAQDNINFLT